MPSIRPKENLHLEEPGAAVRTQGKDGQDQDYPETGREKTSLETQRTRWMSMTSQANPSHSEQGNRTLRTTGTVVKIAVKVIDQTGMEHMTVADDPRGMLPPGDRTGNTAEKIGANDGEA